RIKKVKEQRKLKSKDKDNLPIDDDAYNLEDEEVAEQYLESLFKMLKNGFYYKITQFFGQVNNLNSNNDFMEDQQSDSENDYNFELEEKSLKWKQKLQETGKRIQSLIDTTEISKTDKRTHLEYVGVWTFDNATNHTLIAPNVLVAAKMNLKPGGL
ncbi:6633_t:CDS:2, partial [Dentiscutata erythropus]